MKTAKELAEATAAMALDSLRAALAEEARVRDEVRGLSMAQHRLYEAMSCSDAAFEAWRKATEAVP